MEEQGEDSEQTSDSRGKEKGIGYPGYLAVLVLRRNSYIPVLMPQSSEIPNDSSRILLPHPAK